MRDLQTRRSFLHLASAGCLLPPLTLGFSRSKIHFSDEDPDDIVGKDYLAKGLEALSDAHRFRWNQGHHGAAVIAAYYFCRENALDLSPA